MFTHVVMMKMKDKTDAPTVARILRSMAGQIPELKEIEVGINEIEADRNFDVVLITRFDSEADMDAYQISDYHQHQVLDHIRPLMERSVVVDYNGTRTDQ